MDEKDTFVSQRKDPKLALVVPHFEDDKYLCLNAPKMKTLKLNIVSESGALKRIRCYDFFHLVIKQILVSTYKKATLSLLKYICCTYGIVIFLKLLLINMNWGDGCVRRFLIFLYKMSFGFK